MMTVQANPSRALFSISSRGPSRRQSHAPCAVSVSMNRSPSVARSRAISASAFLPFSPLLSNRRSKPGSRYLATTVCCMLAGEDFSEIDTSSRYLATSVCGMLGDDNKGFSWNPKRKPMGSSRGNSIEDVLREQMEKKEYYDGGSGKKPPFFGFFRSFGFGDNPGDGSHGDRLDDFVQGFAAFLIFALMYYVFLSGPEILLLCSDYIKYLNGRRPSVRLKKEMNNWRRIYEGLTRMLNPNKHWLEVAILGPASLFLRRPEENQESMESAPTPQSRFKNRSVNDSADGDDDRSYDDSDDED